jgi:hypothetical protein
MVSFLELLEYDNTINSILLAFEIKELLATGWDGMGQVGRIHEFNSFG